jgi:hypothetical protein
MREYKSDHGFPDQERKGVDIWSNSEIWLPNQFWVDLVRESGATPNRCTYLHFQDMTPESILEEIWYGSQGLHLIAAPIYVFRNLVGLGQSHLGLDQSQIALNKLFQVGQSTRKLLQSRKTWLTRIKARLPSTRGYHISWTQQKEIGGSAMTQPTRPKDMGQEAHNRDGLEDNYKIKSCK